LFCHALQAAHAFTLVRRSLFQAENTERNPDSHGTRAVTSGAAHAGVWNNTDYGDASLLK
jgi:hypothetical protein